MLELDRGLMLAGMPLVSGALAMGIAWLAYRIGRDHGLRCRSARLDRLYSEVDLTNTVWTLTDTSQPPAPNYGGQIKLQQHGSRLMAEGFDLHAQRWSAEGVVFRRGIHLLFTEHQGRGLAVGSLHLTLDANGQSMTGMKSAWQDGNGHGAITTMTWKLRSAAHDQHWILPSVDDAKSPHGVSTEAFSPHAHPLFRLIDKANTDVVDHTSNAIQ